MKKAFITFHYPVFCRAGLGPIPEPNNPHKARFANAIIVLYLTSALLGAVVYLYFKVDIQPDLERDRHWHALGFLDLKEDFIVIGLGALPAYWFCWCRSLIVNIITYARP